MEEITAAPPPSIIQEVPPVRPAIDPRRYPELGLRIRSIMIDTIVLIALMFGAIYKVLPDRNLEWRDVGVGAIVTAALFTLGKSLIGWYIGTSAIASSAR